MNMRFTTLWGFEGPCSDPFIWVTLPYPFPLQDMDKIKNHLHIKLFLIESHGSTRRDSTILNLLFLFAKSCPTLFYGPMDCSPPGSSICVISWARILEWVVSSVSRESSQPRDQTCCIGRWVIYHWPPGKPNSILVHFICGWSVLQHHLVNTPFPTELKTHLYILLYLISLSQTHVIIIL